MNSNLSKEELLEKLNKIEASYNKIKERANKFMRDNQEVRLYYSCRSNAKRKNIEFSLNKEDIIIPEFCPIFGVKLTNTNLKGRVQTNASIDRIDPSKGYTKDNIHKGNTKGKAV